MNQSEWYDDMAQAVKKREKVLAAIARWQEKLADVEDEITQLTNESKEEASLPGFSSSS